LWHQLVAGARIDQARPQRSSREGAVSVHSAVFANASCNSDYSVRWPTPAALEELLRHLPLQARSVLSAIVSSRRSAGALFVHGRICPSDEVFKGVIAAQYGEADGEGNIVPG
jgi:hypothetical protein